MNENLHEMLAFLMENDVGLSRGKARSLASYFADIKTFLESEEEDLLNIKGISGKRTINLTEEEIQNISNIKKIGYLDPNVKVSENYLAAISRAFTKRQLKMIESLSLGKINPNPFLIQTLNLKTPEELIRINVYMTATRSIVTSMGFFVENLLLASSESVEKGSDGWDIVKTDRKSGKHWVQVKSGPNDMDKDQIVYWAEKIQKKIIEGDGAYIGTTYGKRTNKTVTFGIMKQLLPDWEMKTLIGKELWDFISDDPNYHTKLFNILSKSAYQILQSNSICSEIELCITRLKKDFIGKYGDGNNGVLKYINEIF